MASRVDKGKVQSTLLGVSTHTKCQCPPELLPKTLCLAGEGVVEGKQRMRTVGRKSCMADSPMMGTAMGHTVKVWLLYNYLYNAQKHHRPAIETMHAALPRCLPHRLPARGNLLDRPTDERQSIARVSNGPKCSFREPCQVMLFFVARTKRTFRFLCLPAKYELISKEVGHCL